MEIVIIYLLIVGKDIDFLLAYHLGYNQLENDKKREMTVNKPLSHFLKMSFFMLPVALFGSLCNFYLSFSGGRLSPEQTFDLLVQQQWAIIGGLLISSVGVVSFLSSQKNTKHNPKYRPFVIVAGLSVMLCAIYSLWWIHYGLVPFEEMRDPSAIAIALNHGYYGVLSGLVASLVLVGFLGWLKWNRKSP